MLHRLLLLAVLAILVLVFASAHAQEVSNAKAPAASVCHHGGYELWHGLKVLPVHFIDFNAAGAVWKYQDDDIMQTGAFIFDEKTQYVSQDKKSVSKPYVSGRPEAVWLCYYCSRCHLLLIAYELKVDTSPIG